jgi:hypothetical protein
MDRKCKHCVKSCANGNCKTIEFSTGGKFQYRNSNYYHIYCRFLCFSCAGTANGMDLEIMKSRGTEEWWSSWKSCSGKLCLKNDKMNNVIMDCEMVLFFGNKFLVM